MDRKFIIYLYGVGVGLLGGAIANYYSDLSLEQSTIASVILGASLMSIAILLMAYDKNIEYGNKKNKRSDNKSSD